MPTIKLTLEYEGTHYAGWQRQLNQPTVQEAVETAITHVTQQTISVVAAGRTDAGVHAQGQVVSFRIDRDMTAYQWMMALNAHLPPDISVCTVDFPLPDFHARYKAKGKLYQYRILNRSPRPALGRHLIWHVYKPLDAAAMNQAAQHLIGSHDFSSFETQPTENEDPICHLQRLTVLREGHELRIDAYADRFLKQMVRSIVGTLVEVGHGKRTAESVAGILAARDRRIAGKTAPPQGLSLIRVDY
ncbi:tRNA pseudouridine(38-40) synthase TruA [Nitrospira lenta]|uniref:tRNA pseudouridine synthase A n=1 Tax=Nitrospira lenta TaxID=1436998 RepID=A0A330L6R0_9BACT|nr:tRNA pseudouridine(38-40) synthase TruA [Nitrospira lenta]SPP65600.1 tRNA pseudouridine synthase A [Nitrospira lenta]